MWYIAAVVTLLVEPTSWQYQQYLDTLQNGQSTASDVSETEVLLLWQLLFEWDMTYSTDIMKDRGPVTEQCSYTILSQNK
jgi:hypothetical protein